MIDDILALNGLGDERVRACGERAFPRVVGRDDGNRNVLCGDVVLQPIEDTPAFDIRERYVERYRRRLVFGDHADRLCTG